MPLSRLAVPGPRSGARRLRLVEGRRRRTVVGGLVAAAAAAWLARAPAPPGEGAEAWV